MLETGNYSEEASGDDHFWMTFCDPDKKQIYGAFRCKDFAQDVGYALTNQKDMSIYNFKTDISKKHEYLAISHPKEKMNLEKTLRFFKDFQKIFYVTLPLPSFVENNTIYYKLNENAISYMIRPLKISLHTLLIRIANFYDSEKGIEYFFDNIDKIEEKEKWIESCDVKYLIKIKNIFKNDFLKDKLIYNRWQDYNTENTNEIHHRTGIVSYYNKFSNTIENNNKTYGIIPLHKHTLGLANKNGLIHGRANSCKDYIQAFFYKKYKEDKTWNQWWTKPVLDNNEDGPYYIVYSSNSIDIEKRKENIINFFKLKDHAIKIDVEVDGNCIILPTEKIEKIPYILSLFGSFLRVCPFYDMKYKTVKEFIENLNIVSEKEKNINNKDIERLQNNQAVIDYVNNIVHEDNNWDCYDRETAPISGIRQFGDTLKKA